MIEVRWRQEHEWVITSDESAVFRAPENCPLYASKSLSYFEGQIDHHLDVILTRVLHSVFVISDFLEQT